MRRAFAIVLAFFVFLPLHMTAQVLVAKNGEPQSFLPKDLKDWVIMIGTTATVIGVLLTSWKALAEWNQSTKQREFEFRHKQAVYAREITKEIFNDPKARAALEMLDWLRRKFKTEEGEILDVRRSEIQSAMRAPNAQVQTSLRFSKLEAFIRTRFEALYDRLEEIEKLIRLKIINFEDVETVFRYYMIRVQRPNIQHYAFLEYYDYPTVKAFLSRFTTESKPVSSSVGPPDWLSPSELEDDETSPAEAP